MDIIKTQIVNELFAEVSLSIIVTIAFVLLVPLIFESSKNLPKKLKAVVRIAYGILALVFLAFGWNLSIERGLTKYEKVEAIVDDWNEVHEGKWEILEQNENKVILKRKLTE